MEGPVNDIPFFITANIGRGVQEFFILPDYNEEQAISTFHVLLEEEEIGILKCVDIEEWEWVDEQHEKGTANLLGYKIDNHYF